MNKHHSKQDEEETIIDQTVDLEGNVIHGSEESPEITELKAQAEEYKKQYLRALADYHNLEKRVREERSEMMKIAQANFISRLFPILDILNQAEIFIKDPGLKMVKDSFTQVLGEMGVKELDLIGKEYDPHFAEAIDVVEGEEDNMVVEVLKKGYELHGKVLRPAQVKVSKKVN